MLQLASAGVGVEGAAGSQKHVAGFRNRCAHNPDAGAVKFKLRKQSDLSQNRAQAMSPEKAAAQFAKVAKRHAEWKAAGRIKGDHPDPTTQYNGDEMTASNGKFKAVLVEARKIDRSFRLNVHPSERLDFHVSEFLCACADATLVEELCMTVHQRADGLTEADVLHMRSSGPKAHMIHSTPSGGMDEAGFFSLARRFVEVVGKQDWDKDKEWDQQPALDPAHPGFRRFQPEPVTWFLDGHYSHQVCVPGSAAAVAAAAAAAAAADPCGCDAVPRRNEVLARARCAHLLHRRWAVAD